MARVVPTQIIDLIDQTRTIFKSQPPHVSHQSVAGLTAIVHLIDNLPSEFLTISGTDYSDLVCGVEAIRNSVAFWQRRGNLQVTISDIRDKNVLQILRDALEKCPDQIPSPMTTELAFIEDADLRNSIRLDISAATNALHNGEWKAATVLAGSASEALLLWAIEKSPDLSTLEERPKGSPERWDFSGYITVATSLKLIKDNTKKITEIAKYFRNLIHPGRAQRLSEVCDRATALTALAAVESIARDLASALPHTAHAA
ncbi:hypothetical protein [Novacetimonas maltaceti]|uniref:DUF4145 domain-containing protein n=1 Tax=Novacetimonas maltaceti TaxID=1203393 RepID=A0A2S3W4Y5_9PROT|nr:hypothetical protein [Novacetimonas maltaceti]POF63868.1 hypothetical protein KMAL_03990 [Novacetimonas maltaceti]